MNLPPLTDWKTVMEHPELRAGEVHVWRADLANTNIPDRGQFLSPEECIRAGRFHFERDRERFIAGRSLLRTILGRYLDLPPHDLRFTQGPSGRPELTGVCSSLRFNISHSDDLMLLAVTHARAVGIDLELMRDDIPYQTLADYYFEPEDAWGLRLLPPPQRAWKFYDLWTSFEARLKADGAGLGERARIVEPERWSVIRLQPAEGYAAALAAEGNDFNVTCHTWTP